MGKVIVQYYSKTGHIQQMAKLVAKGAVLVDGLEIKLKTFEVSTAEDILWVDGIALRAHTRFQFPGG